MGIQGASYFTYKTIELSFEQLQEVINCVAHDTDRVGENVSESKSDNLCPIIPIIAVDANNVGFKNKTDPENFILRLSTSLSTAGSKVVVVADGETRHYSKRASAIRRVERERNRVESIYLQRKLSSFRQNNSKTNKTATEKLINNLEKAKKAANTTLQSNFSNNLELLIENSHDVNITFHRAQFQADPLIARLNVQQKCNLVWSNDSDFLIHNPSAIIVNSFFLGKSAASPSKIVLATGTKVMADNISKYLQRFPHLRNKEIVQHPKYPIFDFDLNPESRCLIACAMGNDYWYSGQPGFGPKSALDVVNESIKVGREERSSFILNHIKDFNSSKKSSKSNYVQCSQTIMCFVKAFLFEPANEEGDAIEYIHEKPQSLPYFLSKFAANSSSVETKNSSPEVLSCPYLGYYGETHEFLQNEDFSNCTKCKVIICRYCRPKHEEICLRCHRLSLGMSELSTVDIDIETMKKKLESVCVQVASNTSYADIYDIYEKYIVESDGTLYDGAIVT